MSAHLAEVYGEEVSRDTIGNITDRVLAEMADWQSRPLVPIYPVIFIDAIVRHEAPAPSRMGHTPRWTRQVVSGKPLRALGHTLQ